MKFIHHRLGHVAGGSVVEVTLKGSAANVRLMDQSNFNNYKSRRRHQYHEAWPENRPSGCGCPTPGHGMSRWTCRGCAVRSVPALASLRQKS